MRRSVWISLVVLGVVVVGVVGVYLWQRPLLLTGTGYAAHNACALTHLTGRDDPASDLPPNPLVPVVRTSMADDGATSSILSVLASQRAWFTPGFGCTLGDAAPALPTATTVTADANPYSTAALPAAPDPAPEVGAALDAAFGVELDDAERTALGTRGIVVLHAGELIAERYADGFTADTVQLGWSMTKSLTNLLVGRLVFDGELSLDDDHLRPEWTDERAHITVANLLTMTSGLEWDETYELGTPITRMLYLEPDMGGYVASLPLAHEVGSYQQYSSGSINVLCSVIAPEHGGADFPRAELFAPLGLSTMVLEPDGVGTPVCASYGWGTPRDWAAVGQFALQDGVWNGERLLPEGWIAQSTVDTDTGGEEAGYGLGWWVNQLADGSLREPGLPADTYWASGHDGQTVYVVPSAELVVVRMGFTPAADDRAPALVADLLAALG